MEDQFPTSGPEAASRPFSQTPRLIIIHSTRSGRKWTLEQELYATLNSYRTGGDNSSHCVIDGEGTIWWTVALDRMAWGAEYLNAWSYHIELCQPTRDIPFTDAQLHAAAWVTSTLAALRGIPLVRAATESDAGYIGHEDTAQGKSWGKNDPGPLWDWEGMAALLLETEQAA